MVVQGRSTAAQRWVGLLPCFFSFLQVLQKQVVGARTCKEHPRVGDFELIVGPGQRPVLGWNLVWPVDTVRVEVGSRRAKQRLEGAAVERRKGRGSLTEKLLRRFLKVGNARIVDGCVPVDLDASIDISRSDFDLGRHRVERHFGQPSYQRIAHSGTIGVPDAEPHSPDELELRLDNAALERLLEREELGVKADGLAAEFLFLGPWTPLRIEIGGELTLYKLTPVILGEHDRRLRGDDRFALLRWTSR